MEWKLHKLLSSPKVVSSKAHYYGGNNPSRRQAIVRIHSLQSLTKFLPSGKLVEGSDVPKEVTEFVVIERKYSKGKESPWYVWGTTEETTSTSLYPRVCNCGSRGLILWTVARLVEQRKRQEDINKANLVG